MIKNQVPLIIRQPGLVDYTTAWQQMKTFNAGRNEHSSDEIWLLQHPPVYTQGLNARPEHLPAGQPDIPVVHSDRGGDITYHGPGQLIAYLLIDLKRNKLGIKQLVSLLEQATIDLLSQYGVDSDRKSGAPGIYIANKKIASLGLRVRNGCCYHGLSLNVDMDMAPFSAIPPCGFTKLEMTQLSEFTNDIDIGHIGSQLVDQLYGHLGYNKDELSYGETSDQPI